MLKFSKPFVPTLAHHMKILIDSGIVAARKEGKWMYYSINVAGSEYAAKLLRELTSVMIDETDTKIGGVVDE